MMSCSTSIYEELPESTANKLSKDYWFSTFLSVDDISEFTELTNKKLELRKEIGDIYKKEGFIQKYDSGIVLPSLRGMIYVAEAEKI